LSELGSKFLARVVKPDDLVVLYFSTHGSPASLDPRGRNYLVAHDSDPEDLFATGIEMQKLLDSIQGRVLTDRVLLVLDACHSGFVDPQSKGIARTANFNVNDMFQGSGQLVICSSAPDQRAWESTRYRNGVFTKRFLEGLKKQGETTPLVEAFDFAKDRVQDEVQEDRPGAVQTPVLKGKWSGKELVISTPAAAPQKVPTSVVADLGPDSRVDLLAMK
ncbi:MAG: caspase family protein, partial [Cyanobacteria bacterium HKST-UBA01]|nr:caspase family protein [Cyanobacteria bacterium HKST-UBA01]